MNRTHQRSISVPRVRPRRTLRLALLPLLSPLLIALLAGALFVLIYRAPYAHSYAVGSWIASAEQVYDAEQSGDLWYALTKGAATLSFPELGSGGYGVEVQLAGPGAAYVQNVRIDAGYGWIELGARKELRSLHVLGAVEAADLRIHIDSPTAQFAPDTRPLGVMLARVGLHSLGGAWSPISIVLGAAGTIVLHWLALALLGCSHRRRLLLSLLVGAALVLGAALGRGQVLLAPLWLLLGGAALLAAALVRGESSARALSWRGILLLLLVWRVALWLLAWLALRFGRVVFAYGYENVFYSGLWRAPRSSLWPKALFDTWMQWDALHYAAIATSGYTFANQTWPTIAFFPLYPLAIKALLPITLNNLPVATLLVSHLALLGAVLLLFRLLAREWSPALAYRCIVLLLCFPTAFFFVAGYSEALALLLTVLVLWAIRRRSYWLAGLLGALLALTRVPGVLIGAAIALAFVAQQAPPRRLRPAILAAALPAAGLGAFMAYQQWRFGTPLAFLQAQQQWNNGAGPPWSIPIAVWETMRATSADEISLFTLLVWAAVFWLALVAIRRMPIAYGGATLLILPALLARQPISLTRHVLPVLPLFVALALASERIWLRWAILYASIAGLVTLTALFAAGFFIA